MYRVSPRLSFLVQLLYMASITVSHLLKRYKIHKKEPGMAGAFTSLVKRSYTEVVAISDISLAVEQGELVGFIGPNGAGKTTTLKVLSGLLYPDGGSVSVLGYEPYQRQAAFQKQFALVMGQKNQLWWDLPAQESFLLNKAIYEISDEQYSKIANELIDMLDIRDILKVQVRKLSLGQRMKAELVAALLHAPKVLFLDEPTIGLDVVAQKNLRDFIRDYNERFEATILLTSHYMRDVQELCKRVIVIDHGKIMFDGKLQDIVNKFANVKVINLQFAREVPEDRLKPFGNVTNVNKLEATIEVERAKISDVTEKLVNALPIADLTIEEMPIEDVVRHLFTKDVK